MKYIKMILKNFIDELVVNTITTLLRIGLVALSGNFIYQIKLWYFSSPVEQAEQRIRRISVLFYTLGVAGCIGLIVLIFFLNSRRKFIRMGFNFIYAHNVHTLLFIDRENIVQLKDIVVRPLSPKKCKFFSGHYNWSGTSVKKVGCEPHEKFEFDSAVATGRQKYTVTPKNELLNRKKCNYTVQLDLDDTKHQMLRLFSLTTRRPTKKITLRLIVPDGLIDDSTVKFQAYALFGDRSRHDNPNDDPIIRRDVPGVVFSSTFNDYDRINDLIPRKRIPYSVYEYSFRPQLLGKYELAWKFS